MRGPFYWYAVIILVGISCMPFISYGQPGPPPDPDVPITGIEILIGIGALFGIKKITGNRKHK